MSQSRNILITGSSRGLGKALAEHYLQNGDVVYGCARLEPSAPLLLNSAAKDLGLLGLRGILTEVVIRVVGVRWWLPPENTRGSHSAPAAFQGGPPDRPCVRLGAVAPLAAPFPVAVGCRRA